MKVANIVAIILLLIGIGLFTNATQEVFDHTPAERCVYTSTPPDYIYCYVAPIQWRYMDSRKILYSVTVGLGCVLAAIVLSDTEK